jgi:hypothetical protein
MKMPRKLKLTLSSALLACLLVAGCGTDKQESTSLNLDTFTSPAGNIGCIADDTLVRCDIKKHSWKVKKDPKCQLDYGNGLSVSADGKGEVVCAGDTTLNSGPVLGYGSVNMVGSFECQTDEAGDSMHCENVTTGHGFDLSPDEYSVF